MDRPEYLQILKKYFSSKFRDLYKLHDKIHHDGFIYCKVKKVLYRLKQAAILAYNLLVQRLAEGGYHQIPFTNGLF